jgi:pimeloyl-ACP methyl ester carboxylesterase
MTLAVSLLGLLALMAALAVVTLLRAGAMERAVEAAYPPEGRFVTVDGMRLHAVVMGIGPDLVLIHGSAASARDFTFDLAPALAGRYRVIAVDRPGHGWSDAAPGGGSIHVQARLIREAAAALGAGRPLVMGHSYGGAVALAWAVDAPDSIAGLITVSAPSHPWASDLSRFYKVTSNPLGRALVIPLITAYLPDRLIDEGLAQIFAPQPVPPGYARHFGPRLSLRRVALTENARQRARLKAEITAMAPAYPSLGLPVEQVHGTADATVDIGIHAERLNRDVPGAHLVALPGIGHAPHHVAMDAVIAAIDRAAARAAAGP